MANKSVDEILATAKQATGEATIKLPALRDVGDYVAFDVVQVLQEHRYKDETRMQTNLIIQVSKGHAAGVDITEGKYKLYLGSATLDRIAKQYGFRPGDRVALVLQNEIQTGKATAMKDFAVEIIDAQGRDVKRNIALQVERTAPPKDDKLPF